MADVDSKLEVNNRNGIQLQLGKPRTTNQPSPHVKLENASSLKKVRSIRACPELRLIVDERMKEFRLRNALPKTIFTAQPSHVTFRNFKLNKWYKKRVTLKNISTFPAKFRIEPRPNRSRFLVMIKYTKEQKNIIAPGMQQKLMVYFRCNVVDDSKEILIINVQDGQSIFVRLHAFRDPPILRTLAVWHSQDAYKEHPLPRKSVSSSISSFKLETNGEDDTTDDSSTYTSSASSASYTNLNGMIFDCRQCFVGERISMSIKFKNTGGAGRFFIMSEIDWCSMQIEDISIENKLTLPPFEIYPAYFYLQPQEEMNIDVSFLPFSYGMHVEKLYVASDNCAVKTAEIIGDGVVYETNIFHFEKELKKTWPYSMYIDESACYNIDMGINIPNESLQTLIRVTNKGKASVSFRWQKREVRGKGNRLPEHNHFPLKNLDVEPSTGVFPPSSVICFTVIAVLLDLSSNRYSAVLQLYAEDIPLASVPETLKLHVEDCKSKRRNCSTSVDVWVADIEVWLQCASKYADDIRDKSSITDEYSSEFEDNIK